MIVAPHAAVWGYRRKAPSRATALERRQGGTIITDQPARTAALERLDPLVGTWNLEAAFPGRPATGPRGGQCVFEWMKGRQLLIQRTRSPVPQVPDSIAVIAYDPEKAELLQHYFDSRGVIRLYAMSFRDGVWTLLRDSPDFSPLNFAQRFTGSFGDDGDTIRGTWERSHAGSTWQKDFDLIYRRVTERLRGSGS